MPTLHPPVVFVDFFFALRDFLVLKFLVLWNFLFLDFSFVAATTFTVVEQFWVRHVLPPDLNSILHSTGRTRRQSSTAQRRPGQRSDRGKARCQNPRAAGSPGHPSRRPRR